MCLVTALLVNCAVANTTDTTTSTTSSVCGNSVVETGETCDDGNTVSGDGCDSLCQSEAGGPVCGNGIIETGETCDDGNTTPGDGCDASCQIEVAAAPTMSSDPLVPDILTIGTTDTFLVPQNVYSYGDFTEISDNTKGYGVYITNATDIVSPKFGYWNTSFFQTGSGAVSSGAGGLDQTASFVPVNGSAQNYLIRIWQGTGADVTFDIVIQEGIRGGGYGVNPVISLNTPTWISGDFGYQYFDFTAGATTATLNFTNLTAGLNIDVMDKNTATSIIGGQTADGAAATLTRTQSLTGLTPGSVYEIRVYTLATGGPSVGLLEIVSP